MKKSKLQRKVLNYLAAGVLGVTVSFVPAGASVASAEGWDVLGNVLGAAIQGSTVADMLREEFKSVGGVPSYQAKYLDQNIEEEGLNLDPVYNQRVSDVMSRLIEHGNYAMPPDCLPFRWRVTNNTNWNASCSFHDVILVNQGMMEDLTDDNMLAGVLSHEMIHGLHQHVANDIAKQFLYDYGASILSAAVAPDVRIGTLLDYATNYMKVKNTTNTSEADADEAGFYLMVSAGYNPAGFVGQCLHMAALGNSDRNFFTEFFSGRVSDHPNTSSRVDRAEKRMEEYGYNHVKVKNGSDVYIDDTLWMTAQPTERLQAWENAYLIAGGLCKAFHDNRLMYTWNITQNNLLNDEMAYRELKAAIRENPQLLQTLTSLVEAAYESDRKTNGRAELLQKEQERNAKIEQKRQEYNQPMYEGTYASHCNAYLTLGLNTLAGKEAQRQYNAAPDSYSALGNMALSTYRIAKEQKDKTGAWDLNEIQKAIDFNTKALAAAPKDSSSYWLNINMCAYNDVLDNKEVVKAYADTARSMNPEKPAPYEFLGKLAYAAGDMNLAGSYYKNYIKLGGDEANLPEELRNMIQTQSAEQEAAANDIIAANE